MSGKDTTQRGLRLKRRRLSIFAGPDAWVYLCDGDARPAQVWVIGREAFTTAVREKRIAARSWTVVMPRSDCLVKTVRLPAETRAQARQMLDFEIGSLVPIPADRLSYDILALPDEGDGVSSYLVFLAPRDRLEHAAWPLRQAGVEPDRILPSSLALYAWARSQCGTGRDTRASRGDVASTFDNGERSLFLAVDHTRCEAVSCFDGHLLAAQQVSIEGKGKMDVARLVPEIAPAIEANDSGSNHTPARHILLAGDPDLTRSLEAHVHKTAGHPSGTDVQARIIGTNADVHRVDPEGGPQDIPAVSVLCAIGAFVPDSLAEPFNLLPADWYERRRRRRQWIETFKSAGAVACVFVLLYAYLVVAIGRLEHECEAITRRIEPIREVASELEIKKRQSRIIHAQLSHRALPLQVLAELYRCVPPDMYLSHLSMDLNPADPQLKMRGPAGSLDAAFAFPIALEKSPLFCDVRPDAAQQVTRSEGILVEFGCGCRVSPGASARMAMIAEHTPRR